MTSAPRRLKLSDLRIQKADLTSSRVTRAHITGFLFLLVVIATSLTAQAQDKLSIEQATIQPPIQMGRPIPSWWEVKINGSALVEGRIEFQMKNGDRLLATHTTEDLALTGPQQRIRVLLPPANDPDTDQLLLGIKFRGKRFNQDLGTHILRIAASRSRSFVILTATTRLAAKRSPERDRIVRRLAFESLVKDLDESVKTVQAILDPDDIPQDAHAFCAYEMVILFGDEFKLLKKLQLEALLAWVSAGGSLYLEPTGVLESYHVDFLRKLTEFGPGDMIIQPDSQGRLIPGTIWNDDRLFRITNGLGHVVLRVDDERTNIAIETPEWREATAFLWRMPFVQRQVVRQLAAPTIEELYQIRPPVPDGYETIPMARLGSTLPTLTSELVNWLMPEGVRMVPLWVLGLILATFVVWIGPVDYFGLGWLKARKYTWLTFPLATLLVTGLTVWVTNQYMSSAETRRGLVIRDIGDDGSIVRTNRFELLFIASTRPVTTAVRKGVFSAMVTGQSLVDAPIRRQQQMFQPGRPNYFNDELERRPPARFQGRIPTEFTVTQDLAKWTPQLNRQLWIPGTKDEIDVDWQALMEGLNLDDLFIRRTIDGEMASRIRQKFGTKALMALFGPQAKWAYNHGGNWWLQRGDLPVSGADRAPGGYNGRDYDNEGWTMLPEEIQRQPQLFCWLYHYSAGAPYGLFALTSQIGPAGGSNLEDLPIYDTSDPNLSLLIVIVPQQDDFVVYRKLLRTRK